MEQSGTYTTWGLAKRLWKDYIYPQRRKITVAIICMLVTAAATAANAWMMQPALDDIFIKRDSRMLAIIPVAVVSIALLNSLAIFGQNVMMRYVGQRIISDMQLSLFSHLIRSDVVFFQEHSAGRLISRFTHDIALMRTALSTTLIAVVRQSFTLIFLIGVMLYQSWELTIIAFIAFPLAIHPVVKLGKRMRKLSGRTQEQLGEFSAQLDEVFQGARTVKAYNREDYEIEKARSVIDKLFMLYFKAARNQAASGPIMELLSGVAIAGVIWYGGQQVLNGGTTPGAFFSFITAMIMAYKPVKSMSGVGTNIQEGLASAQRLFTIMDSAPAITDKPGAIALAEVKGHIRFENVSFRYNEQRRALDGISMDVQPGKTVALVGLSGGGKSTLVNLLLRFYEPESGRITIDGADIQEITIASLREHIALVPQETVLFDDTVRNNIAYGRLNASENEIIEAAKAAAAHEFIASLPQGYDTIIGPHGTRLSGGQRQRICIARAMLKNAPILLLDEATSALDNASEKTVQDALARLKEGRTTLVVAHRLSTIIHADCIYVMEEGRIVEAGNHQELLASQGRYAQLYARNFEG